MRLRILTAWLLFLPGFGLLAATNNRSISGSQQFIVFCDDRALRQNLVGAFDEVRRSLLAELGLLLGAPVPIYVNITPRKIIEYNANTWNLRWLDAPDGARVQLDILVDEDIREQRLQEHIVRALLLTIKYRENPPPGGQAYSDAPAWLIEGLSEKIRLQTREPDADLYRGLLNARKVPDLADWLKVDPSRLDATSLGIYRAYACALVYFFQGEPAGNKKLLDYLQNAPTDPAGSIAWLTQHFSNLGSEGKNLAKWWSLSLAKLSASDRYSASSGPETHAALEKILLIHLDVDGEKQTFTLNQYPEFQKHPGAASALNIVQTDLVRLSIRAHPLYRPVIAGYQNAVERLQRGKTKGLADQLDDLETLQARLQQRLQDVSDYLTWFAATQANPGGTGEFESFFRLMQSFDAPRPPSREPIGRYLDAMEAEMKN